MAAAPLPEFTLLENLSLDFAFAFNDVNFSDRIIRIEILPDLPGPEPNANDSLSDCATARSRKRRRVDSASNGNEVAEQSEEQISSSNMPDLKDGKTYQEEAVAVIEESSVGAELTVNKADETKPCFLEGHEVAKDNEPSSTMEYSGVQVRTIHVSSPILAAHSPFFYKLFSNGMKESKQRHVTLQIQASEEDDLMDMLKFMYSNTLPRTTPTALLNVLMVADKFEVASCIIYCSRLLHTLPMTCESALLYLDLPSTIFMPDTVHELRDAAKKFLVDHFMVIDKHKEEVLKLPLTGFEAVMSSDDVQVSCEDNVYEFVLKWARLHYPKLKERREILSKHILWFVRFPFMSFLHLKKVLTCSELEPEFASKVVLDALVFKGEAPFRQHSLAADKANANASFRQYVERSYRHRPMKVVELESPHLRCIAFVDFKREECAELFPSGRIQTQGFHLGEQGFVLLGLCNNHDPSYHSFGLFLRMESRETVGLMVDHEIAARIKHSDDFVVMCRTKDSLIGRKLLGYPNLFSMPWTDFMADDSPYFINGVLHLKVEITIKNRRNIRLAKQ